MVVVVGGGSVVVVVIATVVVVLLAVVVVTSADVHVGNEQSETDRYRSQASHSRASGGTLTEAARCGIQDPRARIMLARTWGDLSRWDEAAATLERLTADYPDFAPGFVWLATARIELGATHQARFALRRATQLNPNDPVVQQLEARLGQLEGQRPPRARNR